ncbi:hypothetical protein Fmac_011609 [Flemingia macrophylla]|uniref:Uncharacterized protein n=1 Tax=Flemingia macrophylla TaxID=520843 RepID=A0ABD1MMX6_9FABA
MRYVHCAEYQVETLRRCGVHVHRVIICIIVMMRALIVLTSEDGGSCSDQCDIGDQLPAHWLAFPAMRRACPDSHAVNQGGKPPGVWKTLLGVIHSVDNGTCIFQICIVYGGLTLEHNFLGMFHSLQFVGQPLSHLAFSYDGQRLASRSLDGIIKVWTVSRNFEGLNLEGLGRSIEGCQLADNTLVLKLPSIGAP